MIYKIKSPKIVCDLCGNEKDTCPECFTVFSHRDNKGWDRENEKLILRDRPDYFHICPECSTRIFTYLCAFRRQKTEEQRQQLMI